MPLGTVNGVPLTRHTRITQQPNDGNHQNGTLTVQMDGGAAVAISTAARCIFWRRTSKRSFISVVHIRAHGALKIEILFFVIVGYDLIGKKEGATIAHTRESEKTHQYTSATKSARSPNTDYQLNHKSCFKKEILRMVM